VRGIRDTKYGFDLLFGTPPRGGRCGKAGLLATQPLVDFWEAHKTQRDGIMFDLPAGETTLKRVRRRLGFNYRTDKAEFWQEHLKELKELAPLAFAARYKADLTGVYQKRRLFFGRLYGRPQNWWLEPQFSEVLLGPGKLREIAQKLGISKVTAFRMRKRLRNTAQDVLGGEILLAA